MRTVSDLIAELQNFPAELPVILKVHTEEAGPFEGDFTTAYLSHAILPGDVLVLEGLQ